MEFSQSNIPKLARNRYFKYLQQTGAGIGGYLGAYSNSGGEAIEYSVFVGATDTLNGTTGLVPQPIAGDNKYYLGGDAKWHPIDAASHFKQSERDGQAGLTLDESLFILENLIVDGNTTLGNATTDLFTVNATSTFNAVVNLNKALNAKDVANFYKNVKMYESLDVLGALNVEGGTTLSSTLDVDGQANFNDTVSIEKDLSLYGDKVEGKGTDFYGNSFTAETNITAKNNLTSNNNTTVGKNLEVGGTSEFKDNAYVDKSIGTKSFDSDIITGYGWNIDNTGAGVLESLVLRSFLEVPELRYNRVTVESGTTWNCPGAGIIKRVDTANHLAYLKLEVGEVGSLDVDDICMGIWHFQDANYKQFNATDGDAAKDANALTVSGFAKVYFTVTKVEDYEEDGITYTNGKLTYQTRYERGVANNVASSKEARFNLPPMEAMVVAGYGNFTNKNRQKSSYKTKTFNRYLIDVNDWDFRFDNIAAQFGDLTGLRDPNGYEYGGYSAYLANIYMSGTIKEIDSTTQIHYRGEYNPLATYNRNDEVSYDNALWVYNSDTPSKGIAPNTTTWSKIALGSGITIKETAVAYAFSESGVTVPTSGWTSSVPAAAKGYYLWTRTVVTYSDSTTTTSYSVGYQGKDAVEHTIEINDDGYWVLDGQTTDYKAEGDDGHSPVIRNGYWYEWNPAINDYQNTGVKAKGEDGESHTIEISDDGYWILDNEKTNYKAEGDDGHSPYIGADGYWYEWNPNTNAYQKTNVKAKGENGDNVTIVDGVWYINGISTGIKAEGKDGVDGKSVTILGSYDTLAQLQAAHPNNNKNGDGYIVAGDLYVWTGTNWNNVGKIQGEPGNDGVTYYTHIAWTNTTDNSDGSFTVSNPSGASYNYFGTCVNTTKEDPTTPSSYKWVYIKGDKGENGKGLSSVSQRYYLSTSSSSRTGGSITTTVPTWTNGKYIWTQYVYSWSNGTTTYGDWVCTTGAAGSNGDNGLNGVSVTKVETKYARSTSNTTAPTSGWSTTKPTLTSTYKYLWAYTETTFGDTVQESTKVVIGNYAADGNKGDKGDDGVGIKEITTFYRIADANDKYSGLTISVPATTATPSTYQTNYKTIGTSGGWWWYTGGTYTVMTTTYPKLYAFDRVEYTDGTIFHSGYRLVGHYGKDGENGSNGSIGLTGPMPRMRGIYNSSDTYFNNTTFRDVVMVANASSATGYNYYIVKSNQTSVKAVTPPNSTYWEEFNEFKNIATGVLLAQKGYIDVLGAGSLFVGQSNAGVTHDESTGLTTYANTANGWVMTEGHIKHTKTGLELTADGYLNDPNGLHFKVNGKNTMLDNSMTANMLPDPIFKEQIYTGTSNINYSSVTYQKNNGNNIRSLWEADGGMLHTFGIQSTIPEGQHTSYYMTHSGSTGFVNERIPVIVGKTYTFSVWINSGSDLATYLNEKTHIVEINIWNHPSNSDAYTNRAFRPALYWDANGQNIGYTSNYTNASSGTSGTSITIGKMHGVVSEIDGWKQIAVTFKIPNRCYMWDSVNSIWKNTYYGADGSTAYFSFEPLINPKKGGFNISYGGAKLELGDVPHPMSYNYTVEGMSEAEVVEMLRASEAATNKALLDTGIDIENKNITVVSDNFKIINNHGDDSLHVDKQGNLSLNGWLSRKITKIDDVDDLQNIGFPVAPSQYFAIFEDGEADENYKKGTTQIYMNSNNKLVPTYPMLTYNKHGLCTYQYQSHIPRNTAGLNSATYSNYIAIDLAKTDGIIQINGTPRSSSSSSKGDNIFYLPWLGVSAGEACSQISIYSNPTYAGQSWEYATNVQRERIDPSTVAVRMAPVGQNYDGRSLFNTKGNSGNDYERRWYGPYVGSGFHHGADSYGAWNPEHTAKETYNSTQLAVNHTLYFNVKCENNDNGGTIYSDKCLQFTNTTDKVITLSSMRLVYRIGANKTTYTSTMASANKNVDMSSTNNTVYCYIEINDGTYKTNEVILAKYAGTACDFLRTFTTYGNQDPHLITYEEMAASVGNKLTFINNTESFVVVMYDTGDMNGNYIKYDVIGQGHSEEYILEKELQDTGNVAHGGISYKVASPRFHWVPQNHKTFDYNSSSFDTYNFGPDGRDL